MIGPPRTLAVSALFLTALSAASTQQAAAVSMTGITVRNVNGAVPAQ
jgi:hypothetical protein